MDSLNFYPAMVNLLFGQVMDGNKRDQDMDIHICSQTMANHQCKWDMDGSERWVMDDQGFYKAINMIKCSIELKLIHSNILYNNPILLVIRYKAIIREHIAGATAKRKGLVQSHNEELFFIDSTIATYAYQICVIFVVNKD